jgi:hypothetical protein
VEGCVELRNVLEHLHAVDHIKFPGFIGQRHGVPHPTVDPRQLGTAALGRGDLVRTEVEGADPSARPDTLGRLICIEPSATAHFQDALARAKL